MNFCAASAFLVPAGIASAQAQSQFAPFVRRAVRALRERDLVGDLALLGIGDERGGDGRVDPHAALALVVERKDLVEAVRARSRRAVLLQQVDVGGDRVMPRLALELRLPAHVEPLAAVAVDHGGDERHVVAPARLAAQADAVDARLRVVDLGRGVAHLVPGRPLGEGHAGLVGQVLAVHQHRALAVERRGVELAVDRQAVAHRRQQVVDVVAGVGLDLGEPALLAPRSASRTCRSS